jgi:hypothetical protein
MALINIVDCLLVERPVIASVLGWFLCGIKFDNIDFSLPSLRDKVRILALSRLSVSQTCVLLSDRVPYVLSHAGLAWLLGEEGFILSVTFSVDFSFMRCVVSQCCGLSRPVLESVRFVVCGTCRK